jgi:hypothetical protein
MHGLVSRSSLSDAEIATMFLSGNTSSKIGIKAGITRERVRQRLNRYFRLHPHEYPQGYNEQKMAKKLHIGLWRLVGLRKAGKSPALKIGRMYIYPEESIKVLRVVLCKRFRICGEPIIDKGLVYCGMCRVKKESNTYPFLSEKTRKNHVLLGKEWAARNLDKVKITRLSAGKNYYAKLRTKSTYTVCTNNSLGIPIGTVVNVVGFDRETYHLILYDGRQLHNRCVHRTIQT